MKHIQSEKYTVAWYKIAECVSRGEKERALGVYRLLSHSFNDTAVARQLEGDIYLSFADRDQAMSLYEQAGNLYKKDKRLLEAAAIYEHLVLLSPNTISFQRTIIELYKLLGNTSKKEKHLKRALDNLFNNEQQKFLQEFLSVLQVTDEESYQFACEYLKR